MPLLSYYLQFHSAGWGLLPGQLSVFLSDHNPCGKHELILWLRWSLVEALLSQPSVTDTSSYTRTDWENSCQRSRRCSMDCPPRVAFFVVLFASGVVFWPPSARLALGQLLSVSAGGFGDSEESLLEKKKEGGREGSRRPPGLCKHIVFCRAPQLSFSTVRGKKRFPSRVPFVQLVVEGMSV